MIPLRPRTMYAINAEISRQQIEMREARQAGTRATITREQLAADVEAYLARGGEIEEVPGYRQARPRLPVQIWGWGS